MNYRITITNMSLIYNRFLENLDKKVYKQYCSHTYELHYIRIYIPAIYRSQCDQVNTLIKVLGGNEVNLSSGMIHNLGNKLSHYMIGKQLPCQQTCGTQMDQHWAVWLKTIYWWETKMSSFWQTFCHWLHWQLSFLQFPVLQLINVHYSINHPDWWCL